MYFGINSLGFIVKHIRINNVKYILRTAHKKAIILGIETSCDDTGCAIVDSDGHILGEALHSQHATHIQHGGIIPPIAQDLHRKHIEQVVNNAIVSAKISFNDIDAIAATVKPGLPLSLVVGMKYGKYLCKKHNKPFIPIHHMKAHALTARMHDSTIEFPFLVLLISGGHCLVAVAKEVDNFLLLGSSMDDAPGEAFDKLARRVKMRNIPEFSTLSGGQAIEIAASRADNTMEFKFNPPLLQYKDCRFSMAGLKNKFLTYIIKQEQIYELAPDAIVPGLYNLCAGFQFALTKHLCHRVQRAMEFVELENIIPEDKRVLVVSGGVACNNFIAKGLEILCTELGYRCVRPPPKLCTDNGVMIAWNGIEKWNHNVEIITDFNTIEVEKDSLIGIDLTEEVTRKHISPKWVQLKQLIIQKPNFQSDIIENVI